MFFNRDVVLPRPLGTPRANALGLGCAHDSGSRFLAVLELTPQRFDTPLHLFGCYFSGSLSPHRPDRQFAWCVGHGVSPSSASSRVRSRFVSLEDVVGEIGVTRHVPPREVPPLPIRSAVSKAPIGVERAVATGLEDPELVGLVFDRLPAVRTAASV
jgi:hypothetical protein